MHQWIIKSAQITICQAPWKTRKVVPYPFANVKHELLPGFGAWHMCHTLSWAQYVSNDLEVQDDGSEARIGNVLLHNLYKSPWGPWSVDFNPFLWLNLMLLCILQQEVWCKNSWNIFNVEGASLNFRRGKLISSGQQGFWTKTQNMKLFYYNKPKTFGKISFIYELGHVTLPWAQFQSNLTENSIIWYQF